MVLSACNLQKNETKMDEPDPSYQEWKREAAKILGDQPYGFPDYDAQMEPLELIYDPSSSDFEFELYRSKEYGISKELSGVHTVHGRYYSFSITDGEKDESDILSGYGLEAAYEREKVNKELSILNDSISEYTKGNIVVYEISDNVENIDNAKRIAEFLESKKVYSGKVLIVNLEGRMNLALYLPLNNQTAEIQFTLEDLDGLPAFLSQLP